MDSRKKQVIVFISSTFRDMHSERDYLVKHVFPELRDWCQKKKGVTLVELDLRWGVTEEEAQGGEVINICLSEIERSRPYFIGLLGERYGWIPPEFAAPDGPILDWLKEQDSKNSITALEILKGVLDDPVMHNLAYFYFRDPAFIEEMPEEKRYEVDAESDESRRLQTELKERIRDLYGEGSENLHEYHPRYGGLKLNWYQLDEKLKEDLSPDEYTLVRDVGSDGFIDPEEWEQLSSALREKLLPLLMVNLEEGSLEAFGRQVLENLKTAIDARFEDKPEYNDPLDVERTVHRDFLVSKTGLFVGRDGELAKGRSLLDEYPVTYVTGVGGSGKSAFMANLIAKWQEDHSDQKAFFYFLGTTAGTQDLLPTLETAYQEITRDLAIERQEFPDKLLKATEFFAEFLASIEQPVLLAFDALDQLQDRDTAFGLKWIPQDLPLHMTIVLSSLPGAGRQTAESRGIPILELGGLPHDMSRQLVMQYLAFYRKKLGMDSASRKDQMELLLAKEKATLPLYLVTAAEELRIFPRYEEITIRIEQLPETVPELFTQVIELLETDFGDELVGRALSLMAVSRAGLTEEELLDLLAPEWLEKLPPMNWSRFYLRIKAYLRGTATADGLLGFFHRQLGEAVQARYLTDEATITAFHRELGEYFTARAQGEDDETPWETGYTRGYTENVYHLLQAGELNKVEQIFGDFAYPLQKVKNGGLASLLEDNLRIGNMLASRDKESVSSADRVWSWVSFLSNKSHVLRRGSMNWPAYKILLQLSLEEQNNSAVKRAANKWLINGRCNWRFIHNIMPSERTSTVFWRTVVLLDPQNRSSFRHKIFG